MVGVTTGTRTPTHLLPAKIRKKCTGTNGSTCIVALPEVPVVVVL